MNELWDAHTISFMYCGRLWRYIISMNASDVSCSDQSHDLFTPKLLYTLNFDYTLRVP